jgi:hypothetical protein
MAENEIGQEPEKPEEMLARLANAVSAARSADVILYSGAIDTAGADRLTEISREKDRRDNVFLILTTRGGSPDAAYRMARCLRRHYAKVILYIHGMCKSAGTLVAIGADEIILSDYGEFGPLDVQLGKTDELFENHSGLNITQALASLNTRVVEFFRESLLDLRGGSGGQLSTRLASEIASKLAIGVYESIYRQVDPLQLGSMERAVQIASFYGNRLAKGRNNLKPNAVDRLVNGYPSHSFVIDIDEASTLFNNVRPPDDTEEQLGDSISSVTRDEGKDAYILRLNKRPTPTEKSNESPSNTDEGATGVSGGSGPDHAVATSSSRRPESPQRSNGRRSRVSPRDA